MGIFDLLRAPWALKSQDSRDKDGIVFEGVLILEHLVDELRLEVQDAAIVQRVTDSLSTLVRDLNVGL